MDSLRKRSDFAKNLEVSGTISLVGLPSLPSENKIRVLVTEVLESGKLAVASLNLEEAPPGDFTPRKGDIVLAQTILGTEQGFSMLEKTSLRCSTLIMVIMSI